MAVETHGNGPAVDVLSDGGNVRGGVEDAGYLLDPGPSMSICLASRSPR
jgi:hypothetical protein